MILELITVDSSQKNTELTNMLIKMEIASLKALDSLKKIEKISREYLIFGKYALPFPKLPFFNYSILELDEKTEEGYSLHSRKNPERLINLRRSFFPGVYQTGNSKKFFQE